MLFLSKYANWMTNAIFYCTLAIQYGQDHMPYLAIRSRDSLKVFQIYTQTDCWPAMYQCLAECSNPNSHMFHWNWRNASTYVGSKSAYILTLKCIFFFSTFHSYNCGRLWFWTRSVCFASCVSVCVCVCARTTCLEH